MSTVVNDLLDGSENDEDDAMVLEAQLNRSVYTALIMMPDNEFKEKTR